MGKEKVRFYLTKAAGDCGRTTTDIVVSAGISKDRLRDWMTGKKLPTNDEMGKFCKEAGIENLYDTNAELKELYKAEYPGGVVSEPKSEPKPAPQPVKKPEQKKAEIPKPTQKTVSIDELRKDPKSKDAATEKAVANTPAKDQATLIMPAEKKQDKPTVFTGMPETIAKPVLMERNINTEPNAIVFGTPGKPEPKKEPKPQMSPEQIKNEIAKLTAEGKSKDTICKELGIGRTTYYKYTKTEGEAQVNEEIKETKPVAAAPVPVQEADKPVRPVKPVKKKKPAMDENAELAFRGIVKKGEITRETLAARVPELVGQAVEILSALGDAAEKLGGSYLDEISKEHIPERLRPLMDAAANASDEGLELATKILRQFTK